MKLFETVALISIVGGPALIGYSLDNVGLGIGIFLCLLGLGLGVTDAAELQSKTLNENIVELLNERNEFLADQLNAQTEEIRSLIDDSARYSD